MNSCDSIESRMEPDTGNRARVAISLEEGVPPRLEEVSDCPIEESDFQEFRKGALECLNRIEVFVGSGGVELTIEDWPLIAVLFAHEDPVAPYSSELLCAKAELLINRITVSDGLIDKISSVIKIRLSKKSWQHYIGERYILKSLCKRFPNPDLQLELISNISSSHLPEDRRIAALCLTYLVEGESEGSLSNVSKRPPVPVHAEEKGTRTDAILDALIRLTRGRDVEVLAPVFKGILSLLFRARCCHNRRSQTYQYVLRNGAMAITLEEKLLYAQVLKDFVASLKYAAREYTNTTLEVLEFWTSAPSTRNAALNLLREMLLVGAVTESWRRVAKILLDCAHSSTPGDSCIGLIEDCREALQRIRKSEESVAEREIFARILRPSP